MALRMSFFSSSWAAISRAFFSTDALDLRQPLRLFLNDAERLALEVSDDPGRQRRADALNGTAAQIPLHGHLVLRCLQLVEFDEQLLPVHGMLL